MQVLVTTTRQALNDIRADAGPADVQARQETYRHAIAKAERAVTKASKAISDVKAAASDMSGAWHAGGRGRDGAARGPAPPRRANPALALPW